MWFAIAWPGIELSTQLVYARWDEVGGQDLRDAATRVEPRLAAFAQQLGDGWRMTGSGSAFFRAAPTRAAAEAALSFAGGAKLDCWTAVATAVG
jgi:4-diphosphocytidyl-2C-methyl-D-erythritol kinase